MSNKQAFAFRTGLLQHFAVLFVRLKRDTGEPRSEAEAKHERTL